MKKGGSQANSNIKLKIVKNIFDNIVEKLRENAFIKRTAK